MDNKLGRKLFAVVMSLALIMTSGLMVFADSASPTVGKVSGIDTTGNYSKKTMAVTWTAVDGATSYNIYLNGTKVGTATGTSYTITGLKAGQNYTIAVAAVKNGKEGEKSTVAKKTLSERWFKNTKIKKAKGGKKKATITWSKTKGATGYQILEKKNGKWVVVKTVGKNKTSATIKKLSKGKHQFRVRAIKGDYIGIWSATKTAKVKK